MYTADSSPALSDRLALRSETIRHIGDLLDELFERYEIGAQEFGAEAAMASHDRGASASDGISCPERVIPLVHVPLGGQDRQRVTRPVMEEQPCLCYPAGLANVS
jgi:hypothetical protein